jgi:hypothetical protein
LVNTTDLAITKGTINAICSPGKAQGTTSKELPKHPKTPELEKLLTVGNADIQSMKKELNHQKECHAAPRSDYQTYIRRGTKLSRELLAKRLQSWWLT